MGGPGPPARAVRARRVRRADRGEYLPLDPYDRGRERFSATSSTSAPGRGRASHGGPVARRRLSGTRTGHPGPRRRGSYQVYPVGLVIWRRGARRGRRWSDQRDRARGSRAFGAASGEGSVGGLGRRLVAGSGAAGEAHGIHARLQCRARARHFARGRTRGRSRQPLGRHPTLGSESAGGPRRSARRRRGKIARGIGGRPLVARREIVFPASARRRRGQRQSWQGRGIRFRRRGHSAGSPMGGFDARAPVALAARRDRVLHGAARGSGATRQARDRHHRDDRRLRGGRTLAHRSG